MFAWWATVWRQQLLAMEWNMWEVKSLVKPWHPCHYPPGQSRLFQYCPKAKKLTSPCGFAGVRLRGGFWGLWWQIPCNSKIRNVFFLHVCCSSTTMSHICSKTKKHAFVCLCCVFCCSNYFVVVFSCFNSCLFRCGWSKDGKSQSETLRYGGKYGKSNLIQVNMVNPT